MKPDKEQVGNRLQLVREELGLSILEFAERLGGYSKSTVNSWLRGLALAPDEVIKKAVMLSNNYSEEWLRWGTIQDMVWAYIKQNRYLGFAEKFPKEIEGILHEVEDKEKDMTFIETKIQLIENVVERAYNPIFRKFVEVTLEKYTEQIPNYLLWQEGNAHVQKEKYKNLVWDKINHEPKTKKIRYGELERLDAMANSVFNEWTDIYFKGKKEEERRNHNILKYLIENTKDEDGVKKIISSIAFQQRYSFYYDTELSQDIINIFLEMHDKLKQVDQNNLEYEKERTFKDRTFGTVKNWLNDNL
ncbi:MAG: helix-turn-helix domain-containing protein [Lactobacillus sp.]|uniref:helix-turn-helix domain-containing protein n=1 Tax=Bacillus cereus TaxID=1396 RepID=UPI0010BD6CF3|nr:helix-turn-helix transcriptional regulator [Bacillus cereus]MCT6901866.1 helix-turn-helix domain-containing protein [Lactobacillus sp.]MCU5551334.1 helix-turn-helix domain-containing protein [Bacillus cereus]TKI39113.1 helix-turn-helix transcriptional regulator [Bacillus cereus]HDR8106644.1 helix-turn-helix transcriptional regulator [Bacillus cereus]